MARATLPLESDGQPWFREETSGSSPQNQARRRRVTPKDAVNFPFIPRLSFLISNPPSKAGTYTRSNLRYRGRVLSDTTQKDDGYTSEGA